VFDLLNLLKNFDSTKYLPQVFVTSLLGDCLLIAAAYILVKYPLDLLQIQK
jgi:hypothetical protein